MMHPEMMKGFPEPEPELELEPELEPETKNQWRNRIIVGLVIAVMLVGFWTVVITAVSRANCWFIRDGVLRELQAKHRSVEEIIEVDRNIWAESVITVRLKNGRTVSFLLDSNIFRDYRFKKKG